MTRDEQYMLRCFDLAILGAGQTSPNPMVGAVLVHNDRIIGEGFHAHYGGPHAEVNAVASVPEALRPFIPKSTLYVSLEPCCVTGKTGPCTSLILEQRIPRVVVSCLDLSPGVAGKGIALLHAAGVDVQLGVLEEKGKRLARVRNHFVHTQKPYVVLKYAVTASGWLASANDQQTWISGTLARRFTHRLRSECDAILVGARTARIDNPRLDNRYYWGNSPLRIVLDRQLRLPGHLHIFQDGRPTLIVNALKNEKTAGSAVEFLQLDFGEGMLNRLLDALYRRRISSLMVEGGAQVLQSFYNEGLWQEAWIITGARDLPEGIPAPPCPGQLADAFPLGKDMVRVYYPARTHGLQ